MTRVDTSFASSDGTCAAWLYTPTQRPGAQSPVIVMAHGLGGVREMGLDTFAEKFTQAGYVCLVFDYRHFGASSGEPRQLLDIDLQLDDWRAAIGHARTLEGVDPDKVVVWGTSFGGGHAIITGADDRRVAAVITQCPFTDGLASGLAAPILSTPGIAARALRDAVGARLGRDPVMISTIGPPGSTAMMTSPESESGILKLIPEGSDIRTEVAARVSLNIMFHFPGKRARDLTCPTLFVICEHDTVAPARQTQKWAAQAPRGEIKLLAAGHFDIYTDEWFDKNIAYQLDFLARHVPVG